MSTKPFDSAILADGAGALDFITDPRGIISNVSQQMEALAGRSFWAVINEPAPETAGRHETTVTAT